MQYMGGKYRQARHIAPLILDRLHLTNGTYWEPFLGGASMAVRVAPHVDRALLTDAHPDLVLMWQALQDGWLPPEALSEAEWRALKTQPSSALRGFAGFGCSFGGRWFEGYGKRAITVKNPTSLCVTSRTRALKDIARLRRAEFRCVDYRIPKPQDWLIYADPPYEGTKPYSGMAPFDAAEFWNVVTDWKRAGATVLVSEYSAPSWAECVWEREAHVSLHVSKDGANLERLFVV